MAVDSDDVTANRPLAGKTSANVPAASTEALYRRVLLCYERKGRASAFARAIVDSLELSAHCVRASLVLAGNTDKASSVLAISGQSDVDQRRTLPAAIVRAARETLDCDAGIIIHTHRNTGATEQTQAHQVLHQQHGALSCLSLTYPLNAKDSKLPSSRQVKRLILVIQYTRDMRIDSAHVKALYARMAPLLFVLDKALQFEKKPVQRALDAVYTTCDRALQGRLSARTIILGACALVLLASAFIPASQHVSAKAAMTAMESRVPCCIRQTTVTDPPG